MTPRVGPPVAVAFVLGAAIVGLAVAGWIVASQIETSGSCFEVCFLDQLVPTTFATLFGISAIINLAILPGITAGRAEPQALPSVAPVVLFQGVLLVCAAAWLAGLLTGEPVVAFLSALLVITFSIVTCVITGVTIRATRLARTAPAAS